MLSNNHASLAVISADGGRSKLIEYKGRKRNQKTNRRPYKGEWREPKLLTIYAVDEEAHRPRPRFPSAYRTEQERKKN